MRWVVHLLGVCLVVATAFWSYRMTYRTQSALDDVADLRAEIAREREAIAVLEAEWAWLNAPERLEALVRENRKALALAPMAPAQFAELIEVPEPNPDDGLEPVAIIGLDEILPELRLAPRPTPRPVDLGAAGARGAELRPAALGGEATR